MTSTVGGLRTGSLRRRLTVVCLGVLCVALLAFDVFLYVSFDAQLSGELDQQLVDRAGLARMLDGELTAQQLADRLAGAGVRASVRQDGHTYRGRPQAPAGPAATPPKPPAPPSGTPRDVVRHGDTLTLAETLGNGRLVLSADRGEVDADLRRLVALEAIGSLVVLAAAALALTVLVRRAVAPLDEMTGLATAIAAGESGQRLHPMRTDTELGRMAGAFDSMLDSLEDAARSARRSEERMREFLGDISHELRTPLAGLVASAEALLRDGRVADPEHERLLVSMVRQSGRAARLIDDLLTLGRLEQGDGLRRQRMDLARVVADEVERTRLLAPGVTVRLHGPAQLALDGDVDRVGQVVANLLDNARHAVSATGTIEVTLSRDAATARLEVIDTGPGVPSAERERIFERLVRLDPSRSRSRFGSGLGLPIARSIARAHGGEVHCAEHSPGARFVLVLQCLAHDADAGGSVRTPAPSALGPGG